MRRNGLKFFLTLLCLLATPAMAQPKTADVVPSPARPADWAQRLTLAKKMHEIRPAKLQVEDAVNRVSQRLPDDQRAAFKAKTLAALDDKKLEETSINAMAQTFTVPELQRMIAYFSTPESKTIADKMPIYEQLVQPEIVRMLDKAMMEARTGAPGENIAPPAATPTGTTIAPPNAPKPPVMAPMTNLPHSSAP